MDPIQTPEASSWGGEIHHVCFSDDCSYFKKSRDVLDGQGISKTGYRCRIDPRGACGALPVWSKDALKGKVLSASKEAQGTLDFFRPDDFGRDNDTPDPQFYQRPRFVNHLDSLALSTVENLYARLIPAGSRVLDLMAGPDSHLNDQVTTESVTGLGMNREELEANPRLTNRLVYDLNANPALPFGEDELDVVINTVSVDYMTRPVEIFREVQRVLRPDGLFVVVFSNRMFPPKAVNIWKRTSESGRVDLVKQFFSKAGGFFIQGQIESKGKPRPADDKYYSFGIPSDPIYAVWAEAKK